MTDDRDELLDRYEDAPDIAVVGMDCRFPQAPDIEQFWRNLLDGRPAVTFFRDEELRTRGVTERQLRDPRYVKAGNVLDGVDQFDAEFFGFSPREAELMDPQHRLLLEVAWGTLDRAACDPSRYHGLIGVYAGASASTYLMFNLATHRRLIESAGGNQVMIGNGGDFLAARISYKLGLEGPSVNVQSACSTSLVAVVLAAQALLSYQCDLALAGGAAIDVLRNKGYWYQEDGLFSPDGYCRSYDSQAQGTVGGNGVGMVALKRLYDALREGDHIHAVIKGSAINNDGARRAGFTAPSADSQALVITTAMASADVEPRSLGYVEGHGTGTILGDPIEVAALNAAFGLQAGPGPDADASRGTIALGSLKSGIGHLDAAAGIAGLIKAVLAVEHGIVPATLHFREPNPRIRFEAGPFFVNTTAIDWPKPAGPRRAGVSSFGLGGTNAHVILEQAPAVSRPFPPRRPELFLLSAKTEAALESATDQLARHIRSHPRLAAADVAHTLRSGRKAFLYRRAVVADSIDDACDALEARIDGRLLTGHPENLVGRPVAFMFTGFGDQYPGMARQLYETEPVFRDALDRCAELSAPHLGTDLRPVIFDKPEPAASEPVDFRRMVLQPEPERSNHPLYRPLFGYPAVFAVEYALAALWRSWGVTPVAMTGHSLGEFVAACVAEVFSLEDALWLTVSRARMIEQQGEGAMLAVALPEDDAARYASEGVALAAVNAPEVCVLSGGAADISRAGDRLAADGVAFRLIPGRSGFHSPLMDPVVGTYRALLERVTLNPPQIKIISNMSGTWLRPEEATSPGYWARHMREPVRFADGIAEISRIPQVALIEVGPGRSLCTAALQQRVDGLHADRVVLPSLPDSYESCEDRTSLLRTAGRLWLAGGHVDWESMDRGAGAFKVPLPGYPFQRQSYWVESAADERPWAPSPRNPRARWLWAPSWQRLPPPLAVSREQVTGCWLVFADQSGLGARLADRLRQQGAQVVTVSAGRAWRDHGPDRIQIDPRVTGHYERLVAALRASGRMPDRVVHCWAVDPVGQAAGRDATASVLALGFHCLTRLLQAGEHDLVSGERRCYIVARGVLAVTGDEDLCPAKATLAGLAKVMPQEYPNLRVSLLDVTGADEPASDSLTDRVMAELTGGGVANASLALRGRHRWAPSFTPLHAPDGTPRLRDRGSYLITGGLGRIGLVLARYLAESVQARLVLSSRGGLPARDTWDDPSHPAAAAARIAAVRDLENAGAEVLVVAADVADEDQAGALIERAVAAFGELNGLIHCAGSTGAQAHKTISELGQAETDWHFEPKIHAVHALSQALGGRRLDFALLCSSVASLLGGLGFSAYAAANAFLDAYAQQSPGWTSINWEAWRFAGDARALGVGSAIQDMAIDPDEGRAVFERVLAMPPLPQVVVSTADITERSRLWSDPLRQGPARGDQRHARPNLGNPYVEPGTDTERLVADVWAQLLGVEQVGVHDNFFEMGGNSLLGLRVVHMLRDRLQMAVPLTIVYEGPTVRTLAQLVDAGHEAGR